MQEQLARAARIAVAEILRVFVWRDMRIHQPQLAVFLPNVAVAYVDVMIANGLDFRAEQDQTRVVSVRDQIIAARLSILCDEFSAG